MVHLQFTDSQIRLNIGRFVSVIDSDTSANIINYIPFNCSTRRKRRTKILEN